jgi:hypothetical protein
MWTLAPSWHAAADYYDIRISGPTFLQSVKGSERVFVAVTDDDASFALGLQGASVACLIVRRFHGGYVEYCVMKSSADAPVQGNLYDCAPGQCPHSHAVRVNSASAALGPAVSRVLPAL